MNAITPPCHIISETFSVKGPQLSTVREELETTVHRIILCYASRWLVWKIYHIIVIILIIIIVRIILFTSFSLPSYFALIYFSLPLSLGLAILITNILSLRVWHWVFTWSILSSFTPIGNFEILETFKMVAMETPKHTVYVIIYIQDFMLCFAMVISRSFVES